MESNGATEREYCRTGFCNPDAPNYLKASGHVDAFNDPLIDNKDSKKRFRADVLIEDYCAKLEDKEKEIEKSSKRFGDAFDKAQFEATNPRVLGIQRKQKPFLQEWQNLWKTMI